VNSEPSWSNTSNYTQLTDEEMTMSNKKKYLGDGVYADFDGYQIKLTAENGISATDTIYLEPAVLEALNRYVEALKTTA
jgi:hypothetical protein